MTPRTAVDIIESLRRGEAIHDAIVDEPIDLRQLADGDELQLPIEFVRCGLHSIDGGCLYIHQPATPIDSHTIWSNGFYAVYLHHGLTIEGCEFHKGFSIQSGGHNQIDKPIIIRNSVFHGFVDFWDAWFNGPVEIRGCKFEQGTNLLGNRDQLGAVVFDVPPVIEGNSGVMDREGE